MLYYINMDGVIAPPKNIQIEELNSIMMKYGYEEGIDYEVQPI